MVDVHAQRKDGERRVMEDHTAHPEGEKEEGKSLPHKRFTSKEKRQYRNEKRRLEQQGVIDPLELAHCKTRMREIRTRLKNATKEYCPKEDLKSLAEIMARHPDCQELMQVCAFDTISTAVFRLRFNARTLDSINAYETLFEAIREHIKADRFSDAQVIQLGRLEAELKVHAGKLKDFLDSSSKQVAPLPPSYPPPFSPSDPSPEDSLESIALKIDPNDTEQVDPETAPRRLRLAERVLLSRTSRIAIVLEKCYDSLNHQAVLRTAECFGVQHVYIVMPPNWKRNTFAVCRRLTRGSDRYLTIHRFSTTQECINQLRLDGREIWATDLSQSSVSLKDHSSLQLPEKMALVIGRETDGVSQEMLEAADKRVFLPMYGFSESLNLSVATALIIQQLFFICPEALGSMEEQERSNIRALWYGLLSS